MNKDDFDKLDAGDVIYRRATTYVVIAKDANGIPLAVPVTPVTDPDPWRLAHKAKATWANSAMVTEDAAEEFGIKTIAEAGNSFGQVAFEAEPKKRRARKVKS